MVLYSGVNPDVIKAKIAANQPLEDVEADPNNLNTGALDKSNNLATMVNINRRPTNILYRDSTDLSNLTFYIKGYFNKATNGYDDSGSGHDGGSDTDGGPTLGNNRCTYIKK